MFWKDQNQTHEAKAVSVRSSNTIQKSLAALERSNSVSSSRNKPRNVVA